MEKETLRVRAYELIGYGYEDSVIAARLGTTVDIISILRGKKKS